MHVFAEPLRLTATESDETKQKRIQHRAYLACDLLLARLFIHHPDHAIAALKGIKPNVVDSEPAVEPDPPPPAVIEPSAEIIPIPTETMADMIGKCPSMATIVGIVCRFYDVKPIDICSDRRTLDVAMPRQIVMYLARKLTTNSLRVIGRILGNRDHSTVAHASAKISNAIKTGGRVADEIEVIQLHISAAVMTSAA